MKRISIFAIAIGFAMNMAAQETYESAKIASEDLNGTARFVSMGGALDALGADISTIRTNPAGIGLFRHSMVSASFGMVSQQDAAESSFVDATNMSFDQVGFVYSKQTRENSFFNFGFSYHKSRNFDYILSAQGALNGTSQNKVSYMKMKEGYLYPNASGDGQPYSPDWNHSYSSCNQLDDIYANNLFYASGEEDAYYYDAKDYNLTRGHKGYIGVYDFNFSGNLNNRVFLGLTMGIHDVHYKHSGVYTENMVPNPEEISSLTAYDDRRITGAGFDVKAGVIFRPVETSPFRIGLSVATPTWYSLTTTNSLVVMDNLGQKAYGGETYDYKLYTPWKFGLSLGHTIGSMVAIGAGFDYADYSALDNRIIDGEHYDWYTDSYYNSSSEDVEANSNTERSLKGVCTFKVGAEVKPTPEMAFRLGYNVSTAMYDEKGFKDGTLDSPASYYSSATDYTNWKATNHITAGFGYTFDKLSLDLAYQYTCSKGDFKPFMEYDEATGQFGNYDRQMNDALSENIYVNPQQVDFKRHQLILTLGYHF
ncbi:MAG: hemin receptor [Prevotella sp.]|nr:hemin receptor [Prevotella sp.]